MLDVYLREQWGLTNAESRKWRAVFLNTSPDWHREAEETYGLIPEGLQAARKTLGEISRKEPETAMIGFGESLIPDRLGEWVTAPVDLPDATTFVSRNDSS
jgi:hypothetical protein